MLWRALLIFVLPCHGFLLEDNLPVWKSDLFDAADDIISTSFKSDAVTINFIVSLSEESKRNQNYFINNLIERCDVVVVEDVPFILPRQRLHNVILIEDFQSFVHLVPHLSSKNFVIDGYFLLIFIKGPIPEIVEIAKELWKMFIYNVDFLVATEIGTNLMTFLPFSETNCDEGKCEKRCDGSTQLAITNFNKTLMVKKDFYPKKISNMLQCPLKVVTFNCPPMMMIQYDEHRQKFNLRGIDGEMLQVLSELLNFEIDLIHISDLIR